jgi:hypothetical protein
MRVRPGEIYGTDRPGGEFIHARMAALTDAAAVNQRHNVKVSSCHRRVTASHPRFNPFTRQRRQDAPIVKTAAYRRRTEKSGRIELRALSRST